MAISRQPKFERSPADLREGFYIAPARAAENQPVLIIVEKAGFSKTWK
jgi:hypothetical protein